MAAVADDGAPSALAQAQAPPEPKVRVVLKHFYLGPKRDRKVQITMVTCIVGIAALYALVTGYFLGSTNLGLVLAPTALLVMCLVLYIVTACTEPGIVPPGFTALEGRVPQRRADRKAGDYFAERRCEECSMLQESYMHHCKYCGVCVRELDHHCPVVGNCIGARNKVPFVFLQSFASMSTWAVVITGVFWIVWGACKDCRDGLHTFGLVVAAVEATALLGTMGCCLACCCTERFGRFRPDPKRPYQRPILIKSAAPRVSVCCGMLSRVESVMDVHVPPETRERAAAASTAVVSQTASQQAPLPPTAAPTALASAAPPPDPPAALSVV